jgi:glycosyltransferase involved in cell wall biosynthesis
VPTYNRSGYLGEALTAMLSQTTAIAEIIVWDDGSTDGTPSVVRTVAARAGNRLRYHRGENGGKSRALNAAMEHVRGDLVWICDDDDIARPDAAERMLATLERSGAGLVAGKHVRFTENPETGERTYVDGGYWPDLSQGSVLRHVLEDIFFFQNATLVRRACYEKVGPFREDLARSIDYDMTIRLVSRFPIEMIDEALFEQRKHPGARGPAAGAHAARDSEQVWQATDRAVFQRLRDVLPLSLYSGLFATDDPVLARRAGLLQRACVYARRGDWATAFDDMKAAAGERAGALTALEWQICRRAMAGKHGASGAFARESAPGIAALREAGPVGASMARGLARGALWRAREAWHAGQRDEVFRIARFIVAATARGRPLTRMLAAPRANGRIIERRTIPPEVYAW